MAVRCNKSFSTNSPICVKDDQHALSRGKQTYVSLTKFSQTFCLIYAVKDFKIITATTTAFFKFKIFHGKLDDLTVVIRSQ